MNILLLGLIISITDKAFATTCENFKCFLFTRGNRYCDIACMNKYCNFDSPSNSSSYQEVFKKSDCYQQCVNTGCNLSLLGNGVCDDSCSSIYCGLDLGDCGICSKGCTSEMLDNDICNKECNNTICYYDNNWCKEVCGTNCTKDLIVYHPNVCFRECLGYSCNEYGNFCYKQCSKDCLNLKVGDSKCNLECMTNTCSYDKDDCSCAPGCDYYVYNEPTCREKNDPCNSLKCKLKGGKCGFCASGCFEDMIGNGVCNQECNNKNCNYDLKDCGCSLGCSLIYKDDTWYNIEDNVDNQNCFVPACFYNVYNSFDPFLLRQIILSQINYGFMLNTSFIEDPCGELEYFDEEDNSELCNDNDECYSEYNLWCLGRSQLLDSGCLRQGEFSCLIGEGVFVVKENVDLASECPESFVEVKEISEIFSKSNKLIWCLPHPENYDASNEKIYYVQSSVEPASKGSGTLSDPFLSLYYCFTRMSSVSIHIILSEGDHLYQKDLNIQLILRNDPDDPLNYDIGDQINSITLEGSSYSNPSKVYWIGSLKISSSALKFYMKNIDFYGDQIIRNDCDGSKMICYYCPIYYPDSNTNDKDEEVSDEDLTFYLNDCSPFVNDELFTLKSISIIENVKFLNFRHQFKNLIRSYSTLNLTNIEFGFIQPGQGGNIIYLGCEVNCARVNFTCNNCNIHEMNIGYEYDTFTFGGSFLRIENIYSIKIEQLKGSYNVLQSSAYNFLIFIKNCNSTIVIKNSIFEIMLLDNLIVIDNSSVGKYVKIDIGPDKESISHGYTHLEMENLTFYRIYTYYDFISYVSGMHQNIKIQQVVISYSSSKSPLIYLRSNYYVYSPLGIKTASDGSKYKLSKLFVELTQISILSSSTHDNVISIISFPYVYATRLSISNIRSFMEGIYAEFIYFDFFMEKGYFSNGFTDLTVLGC